MRVLASPSRPSRALDPAQAARRRWLLSASRLLLPLAFFGYGAWANLEIAWGGRGDDISAEGSVLRGEAMAGLTEDYARAMPHRDAAVGWWGAARYALLGEGRDGVLVGEQGWLFTEEELAQASDSQIARAVEEALAAQAQLAERGARLVVVPVPAKIDIHRDKAPSSEASRAMEDQHRRFLAALAQAGIPAVDARPALAEVAQASQAFLARDTHWTPAGTEAVARAVAQSGFIPAGQDGFRRRAGEPQAVGGDLVSFVTSPGLAQRLGLGPETVEPFAAQPLGGAAAGIFATDAPAISTLLVGTSYSADDRWSFAPALSLALSRDVLNLAEEGQGPVLPLRSLLDDPAWVEAPPDYVIWEFPVRYLGDPSIWPGDLPVGAGTDLQGNP